jgi:NADH-quinone oxidoreductase subunit H
MPTLIFGYLIFPGFLFSACIGLIASWVDRKVTARLQWRVGPPWYQPFADIVKLSGKETIVPYGASKILFLIAPLLALISISIVSTLLGKLVLLRQQGFLGDLIVVLYLLILPAVALILGSSASANPLASLGISRETKLLLAYELPFILSIIVAIIKTAGSIRLESLINYQTLHGSVISSLSGILAFLISILCMQAKLGLVPFDMAEAETEIAGGAYIEYSGPALAMFKLTKALMLYVMPLFLITVFWAGNLTLLSLVLRYVVLLVIIVLVRNTNPRLRIDQAIKFFWGPMSTLAIIAVVLAVLGQ